MQRSRVALYARVSTDEQAKSGYSIQDQKRTLLDYAEREGYEVVETIEDDGWSGATPDRPGIRLIYELAEAGEIDVVFATKRDRFFRSRLHRLLMDRDLKEYGVSLVSLTDTGNPIGDGVLDDFAEWEREQTAERTQAGKRSKAREGKVVGGHPRSYGFRFNEMRDGYVVDEVEMRTVRRIFSDIARGMGIRTVKEQLDRYGVPTPGGGKAWSRPFLRDLILDDLYKPHTVEELRELGVSEDVLVKLDPDNVYGVYRFDDIPVPILDAGLAREVVEAARYKVENNRSPSKSGDRFWELSGGILYCSGCGRRMQTQTVSGNRRNYYYRCQGTQNGSADRCAMRPNVRADVIEAEVWEAVRRTMDSKEYLLRKVHETYEAKRREVSGPGMDGVALAGRLEKIETKWVKYQRAYEADAITLSDLKARRAELEQEREVLGRALEGFRNREAELTQLAEAERSICERVEQGYGDLEELDTNPQKRREVYQDLHVRVEIGADKRPQIWGIFRTRSFSTSDGHHTIYIMRAEVSSLETSPERGGL